MQRFWKGLAAAGVLGIFYVGHGLHRPGGALPGESVAAAQSDGRFQPDSPADWAIKQRMLQDDARLRDGDFKMQSGKPITLMANRPAVRGLPVGTYQLLWVPPPPGCSPDYGLRRLNTTTGVVEIPVDATVKNNGVCEWMPLSIKP